jgi:hypothetical protein
MLLKTKKISLTYSGLAHALFEMIEKIPADHSIVLATVNEIVSRYK